MNLWPILVFVMLVSSSMQIDHPEDKSKSLTCYSCNGPTNDPFCRHPEKSECLPGYICYFIHLKSIGVAMGCSKTVAWNDRESEYCHRYSDQFDPFISTCYDCSSEDLCNSNAAMATKLFYPLVVVGLLINVHFFH